MLKQLIDVKSNKIFVLQTAGKGTSCPACVWQTDLHTGTTAVCEPALSFTHDSCYLSLWDETISNKMTKNDTTLTLTLILTLKVFIHWTKAKACPSFPFFKRNWYKNWHWYERTLMSFWSENAFRVSFRLAWMEWNATHLQKKRK